MVILNVLLSYPRSGNHLTRFFIELLSEIPTYGANIGPGDVEIYKNTFPRDIPFNIKIPIDETQVYHKRHFPTNDYNNATKMIFLLRNPREVLLREHKGEMKYDGAWNSFDKYFKCVDSYLEFKGDKILFYYEDLIEKRKKFIRKLYKFLNINNKEKLNYTIANIDFLYDMSKQGEGRAWGGVNSNSKNFYYPNVSDEKKKVLNDYLKEQLAAPRYKFIKDRYNID
jgi:hypothetical protein